MLENYTWPVAFTAVSTIITIVVAAYKAYTRKPSDVETKLQTQLENLEKKAQAEAIDFDRRISAVKAEVASLIHGQEELKDSIKSQAQISKEAFQTTDKKLEKISDLIIELIRN